ncbi:MAG: hypothetical protein KKG59_04925 [Nanoarchaeota archaeon]|nr:hypothetical protein [Nanoarchaeota archaeon]
MIDDDYYGDSNVQDPFDSFRAPVPSAGYGTDSLKKTLEGLKMPMAPPPLKLDFHQIEQRQEAQRQKDYLRSGYEFELGAVKNQRLLLELQQPVAAPHVGLYLRSINELRFEENKLRRKISEYDD